MTEIKEKTMFPNSTNPENDSLIQETLYCLEKTFKEKNNVERIKAERRLKELEGNILGHIKSILKILSFSKSLDESLKLSLTLYFKNILRSKIELQEFSEGEFVEILQTFIEIILTGNLTDTLLQNINIIFTILLNSNYLTSNSTFVVNMCEFLLDYVKKKEGNLMERILGYKPVIFLYQVIVSSTASNFETIFAVIAKQLEGLDLIIGVITNQLKSINYIDDNMNFLLTIDILRYLLDFIFLSLLKFKKLDTIDSILPVYLDKFLLFLINLISFSNQSETNLIIMSGDNNLDSTINAMKSKAFQVISLAVQNEGVMIKNQHVIENFSKVVTISLTSLNHIVNEKLGYLSEMDKNSNEYPDNNYETIIFQILLFLSRFLNREPIISQFAAYVKNFVLGILFPLLSSTKQEYIKMKIEGEEYHKFVLDLYQSHKEKSIKTAVAFLLVKLCDKYDGLCNFLMNFCLQLVDFVMNGSEMGKLGNYNILNVLQTEKKSDSNLAFNSEFNESISKILLSMNPEIQIDNALLVIIILNKYMTKNVSCLAVLRIILESHCQKFFTINSEFIKDKLCLIYGTFLDEIYQKDEVESFFIHISKVFEFLFFQILNFKQNPGLAYQASYSLNQLLYYKEFLDVTNKVVRNLMPQLIENIKEIEVILFFDVIIDIVLYLDIEDSLMALSKAATTRLLKEIKSPRKDLKEKGLNVYISKCFHILRTVLDENKMISTDQSQTNRTNDIEVIIESDSVIVINDFETIIEPVVSYIKNPNKIDFDDEIILLMTSVIENAKSLTNLSKLIIPSFPAFIIKYEGMTEELFELLNLYIIYDSTQGYLISDNEAMTTLIDIIKISMEETNEENSPIFGCMLTQVWLQSHQKIPDEVVSSLITVILKEIQDIFNIYRENIDQFNQLNDIYLFTSYLTTIYSAFNSYTYLILKNLFTMNLFNDLILWTEVTTLFNFSSGYQSKVIILGICNILSDPNLVTQLSVYINKFLFFVFTFLTKQKNEESKKLKNVMKKELDCNFIHSDEEDVNEEDDEEDTVNMMQMNKIVKKMQQMNGQIDNSNLKEHKEMIKLITKLKAPVKQIDEYRVFNDTLQKLNTINNNIIPQWIENLSEVEKFLWKELVHTRRVQVSYSGVTLEVPRRTVRIKRSNNSDIQQNQDIKLNTNSLGSNINTKDYNCDFSN